MLAWAGGGDLTDKRSGYFFFIFIFYRGDSITSMEGVDLDPYQYSFRNLEYL